MSSTEEIIVKCETCGEPKKYLDDLTFVRSAECSCDKKKEFLKKAFGENLQ